MKDTTKKTRTLDDGELEKAQGGQRQPGDLAADPNDGRIAGNETGDHAVDLGQIGGLTPNE